MITKMELIPVMESSYPFQSAAKKCEFVKIGYIEEEYFMSGTANIYTETGLDHQVDVLIPDVPYTTRLLVRKPRDISKFSGNVVIEILNATAMMDIDRIWINTWKYMARNGDIYIGITSKGHVVDTLKRFHPERYDAINWNNPDKSRKKPKKGLFPFLEEYESGLYWDMQNELAKLLRTKSNLNPIREYGNSYLYLAGWSQSGTYLSRTVNSFSYRSENTVEGPLFDGYYSAGSDASLAPINTYETESGEKFGTAGISPVNGMLITKEPLIAVNTESENKAANWSEDSDCPNYKFRSYQIAGTSHDSYYNMIEYYEGYLCEDAKRSCVELQFEGIDGEPLDTPYEYIFQAALRNLYLWVREEIPAPHAPRIEVTPAKDTDFDAFALGRNCGSMKIANKKDLFGNTIGGIRMALLDYPIGIYKSFSVRGKGDYVPMFGTVYPFSKEKLEALYGNLKYYQKLVEQSAEETIALGFLLREDKDAYVETIVNTARRRGLE